MNTTASSHGQFSNAEILLWQGRFRRVFVFLVGVGMISMKWAGVLASDSVVAHSIGAHAALLWCAAMFVAYLAFNEVLNLWLRRRAQAGNGAIAVVVTADLVLLFLIIYFATPPTDYTRALILSVFTVQVTQAYFGQRATIYHLGGIAIAYTLMVVAANDAGELASPAEHFWTLGLFMAGSLLFSDQQGRTAKRLQRIMEVFERAKEGDFSMQYDEKLDRMPDSITLIGRAYNRMRGHLETIVLTDPLSGCYNRRGFDQLVQREVARAVRGANPMAVLAIDVDHFKSVNDEYGHLTGDEVIREIGVLLRATARLGDVVARTGGEEFEILAPDTSAEGASILADRVRTAFATRPFASLQSGRKITVSIGVASEKEARNDSVASTLIARADEALYVAKRKGRDQCVMWEPGVLAVDAAALGRRSVEQRALPE